MPVIAPPTLNDPGLSPDRSDRATFSARAIALDDFTKNVQIPQLRLALANVSANASDAATSATTAVNKAAEAAQKVIDAAGQVTLATNQVTLATAEKNAAALSAQTSAQSAALPGWVTGTNYATGQRAISLISGRAYLSLSTGVSTTDPINDTSRWRLITANRPVVLVTTTAQTASAGSHYVMTNPALTSLTLPASPVSGDEVEITFANGRVDNLVLRNGKGLLVNNDGSILLEDLVFDSPNSTLTLAYAENAWRFKMEGSGLAISDSAGATAIAVRNSEEATALALRNSTEVTARASRESVEAAARISRGYEVPIAYTAGISLTRATQTVSQTGVVYAPALVDLPFTTSGTFETAKFRVIQGVAGVDLAAGTGGGLVGFTDAQGNVGTIAGMAIKQSMRNDRTTLTAAGESAGLKVGICNGTEGGWLLNPGAGDFVTIYPYISSSAVRQRVWAINPITDVPAGSPATAWCMEGNINVATGNAPNPRTVNHALGIDMVSGGPHAPSAAFACYSSLLANRWKHGVWFDNVGGQAGSTLIKANANIDVDFGLDLGAAVINKQAIRVGVTPLAQAASIGIRQLQNGQAGIFLQRNTDTAPTGLLLQVVNAANSVVLSSIDASGNIFAQGKLETAGAITAQGNISTQANLSTVGTITSQGNISTSGGANISAGGLTIAQAHIATAGAPVVGAAQISYGATLATTATSGAAGALPATPSGYIIINVAGVTGKIPFYNA